MRRQAQDQEEDQNLSSISRSAGIRSAGQVHFRSAARLDLALVGQNNWLVYLAQLWQEMCTHIRSISCSFSDPQLQLQVCNGCIHWSWPGCRAVSSKLSNLTTQFAINNQVPSQHTAQQVTKCSTDQLANWATNQMAAKLSCNWAWPARVSTLPPAAHRLQWSSLAAFEVFFEIADHYV